MAVKMSKEQAGEIFHQSVQRVADVKAIGQSKKPMAALQLACRRMLKAGIKDAGYAANLLGFAGNETMYGQTGKTHKEAFTACWNKVLSDARLQTFHRCVEEIFGVSIDGQRGQASKNLRFLLAAERSLDMVPPFEVKIGKDIYIYDLTPTQWIATYIDEHQATEEKWKSFKEYFQAELQKYTTLRSGREDFSSVFDDEESF